VQIEWKSASKNTPSVQVPENSAWIAVLCLKKVGLLSGLDGEWGSEHEFYQVDLGSSVKSLYFMVFIFICMYAVFWELLLYI